MLPKGTAPVKAEYLVHLPEPVEPSVTEPSKIEYGSVRDKITGNNRDGSNKMAGTVRPHSELEAEAETDVKGEAIQADEGLDKVDQDADADGEPPAKRIKLSGAQRKKLAKERREEERKKSKGQNKGRRFRRVHDEGEICWKVACGMPCAAGESCRWSHDLPAYLQVKPADIHIPESLFSSPPFVSSSSLTPQSDNWDYIISQCSSASPTTRCPSFDELGECKHGYKCRFLGAHLQVVTVDGVMRLDLKVDASKKTADPAEYNGVDTDLLKSLRKREYPFVKSKKFVEAIKSQDGSKPTPKQKQDNKQEETEPGDMEVERTNPDDPTNAENDKPGEEIASYDGGKEETSFSNMPALERPEKKRLHWEGLTYLAPLTTVGNLPFRRLCVTLGVDITCGEMGLSHSFLQGSKEEWSLVRRHPSERIFGVQIAGNKPEQAASCAEAIGNSCDSLDFVDLNCGCPIDLVYQAGSGSALLNVAGKMGKCLQGMNYCLGEVPVTVKMRTGVKDGAPTAHKLMPRLHDWGVSSISLHGRTRQQRYTRLADWSYIKQCASTLRSYETKMQDSAVALDADVATRSGTNGNLIMNGGTDRIHFWGNGDCFSGIEYWKTVEATGVDGIMIGRGALIKPWIFTEIKERRDWDISSRERLELIKKYAEFGLCHFGSDTSGVNTTRRYLCEMLSFTHRYIPIGLLESLPPKLNDRAPAYRGRDELETLLASPDSKTWVKISEMFLGPVPSDWTFIPKHKSNAYGSDEATEAQG